MMPGSIMSLELHSGDKSLFPTTIVMFVLGSINEVRSREHGGEMRAAKSW